MSLPVSSQYFTPNEVCVHNTVDDLWVSFLGKVYDLTPLCEKYKGSLWMYRVDKYPHRLPRDTCRLVG